VEDDRALGEGWHDHPPVEGELDTRFDFNERDDVDTMVDEEDHDKKKSKKKK
jgi:hypothetical protein